VDKRGDFGWEEIAKLILVLFFLIILILIITLYKDKAVEVINNLKDFLRFGR